MKKVILGIVIGITMTIIISGVALSQGNPNHIWSIVPDGDTIIPNGCGSGCHTATDFWLIYEDPVDGTQWNTDGYMLFVEYGPVGNSVAAFTLEPVDSGNAVPDAGSVDLGQGTGGMMFSTWALVGSGNYNDGSTFAKMTLTNPGTVAWNWNAFGGGVFGINDGAGVWVDGAMLELRNQLIDEESFNTIVITTEATNVGSTTATLNGQLLYTGTSTSVNASFEYGTQSGSYPCAATAVESPMSGTGAFHADLSGLIPNTIYYVRAKVEGFGTDYGDELSFFTHCSLISYWPFESGTGTIAYDSIGSNDGTLAGNTWWTTGILGGGLSFDGDADYVSLPENSTLRPARITQLAWVNPATLGGVHPIMSLETTTGSNQGAMLQLANGLFQFYVGTGYDKVQYVSGTVTKANEWYQVAGTYDGTEACIWINGEKVDCEPLSGNISYDTARDMRIGSWAPATPQYFNGIIDEVRVYDRALTGQEIEDLYKQELINIYVNLQGNYRPVDGWEVPINVGFYPPNSPDSWLLNPASATYYFSGTTALSIYGGGTRAYFQCPDPVNPGTYDVTAVSTTTLLNVKRNVSIW